MAQVYRSEERWEALYETIHFILSILRWFPDIVDDTEEKVKKYKEEIRKLESILFNKLFDSERLLTTKVDFLKSEINELFEQETDAEKIKSEMRKLLIMGRAVPESLNDLAFIMHFENTETALQLWEAHIRAAWCYAAIYSSGLYRPPFSVVTCRIPEWLMEFWDSATPQQRYRIVDGLLLISELGERFDRWIALEARVEWLRVVCRWLLWRGRWRSAKRLQRLTQHIREREAGWQRRGFSNITWLLPVLESESSGSGSSQLTAQTNDTDD